MNLINMQGVEYPQPDLWFCKMQSEENAKFFLKT